MVEPCALGGRSAPASSCGRRRPHPPWRGVLAARRAGLDPDADLRPALAAGVALTAFQTGLRRWVDSDGTKAMDELVDQAFAMITPALDLSTDPH
jgi:hypothetical protein